jgi:hypothetical protein
MLQEITQGSTRTKTNVSLLLYIISIFVQAKEYDLAFKAYTTIKKILPKEKLSLEIRLQLEGIFGVDGVDIFGWVNEMRWRDLRKEFEAKFTKTYGEMIEE